MRAGGRESRGLRQDRAWHEQGTQGVLAGYVRGEVGGNEART